MTENADQPEDAPQQQGGREQAARRRRARLYAVQALYQALMTDAPLDTILRTQQRERLVDDEGEGEGEASDGVAGDLGDPDGELMAAVVRGAVARRDELDDMVAGCLSDNWPLDRLETVLRLILQAGAWELLARPEVPAKVVIEEYVELAKAFFDGGEPGMVNAVLDSMARVLRDDLGEDGHDGHAA